MVNVVAVVTTGFEVGIGVAVGGVFGGQRGHLDSHHRCNASRGSYPWHKERKKKRCYKGCQQFVAVIMTKAMMRVIMAI